MFFIDGGDEEISTKGWRQACQEYLIAALPSSGQLANPSGDVSEEAAFSISSRVGAKLLNACEEGRAFEVFQC